MQEQVSVLTVARSCILGQPVDLLQAQPGKGVWGEPMPALGGASHRPKDAAVQVQSTGELIKLWREGKVPLLMVAYSWMLGQVGDALGVQPGEEFRVALVEAQKVGDTFQTRLLLTGQTAIMPLAWTSRRAWLLGVHNFGHSRWIFENQEHVLACKSEPRWCLRGLCQREECWHAAGLHCLGDHACGLSAAR